MHRLVCIFLFVSYVISQWIMCPYKICTCGGNYIFCTDKNLKEIPAEIAVPNPVMTCLNMDSNQISKIPAGSLPSNLSLITLQGNPIESIDDNAFDGSTNTLQSLAFCQARFTSIPTAVLNLKNLEALGICNTNIRTWDAAAMEKLGASMTFLNLDTVGLTQWPTWLKSYSHLTDLGISGSSIAALPDDALDMAAETLTTLTLQNNSLSAVPKAISKLTVLYSLNLQNNRIVDITWLPQRSKLSSLLLSNNMIINGSALSNALSVYATSLYEMEIHDNYLISMPNISFLSLVQNVDLTNNHISDINSGVMPPGITDVALGYNFLPSIPRIMKTLQQITQLRLNSNRISAIRGADFPPALYGADFGYNLITELTMPCFPQNSSITVLILNYNPISQISPDAFNNLPHLHDLNLQHTKLTRLPLSIASMNSLNFLDVSGSAQLICTCLEKSLQFRIKSMLPDNVVGDCGSTSVYVFFTKLSPSCPPFPGEII